MRSLDDALDQFAFHPATPKTAAAHAGVRDVLSQAVRDLWPLIPDGPEKTTAIRRLQECGMYAQLAIALQVPADTSATRMVARVLPEAPYRQDPATRTDVVPQHAGVQYGHTAVQQTPGQAESGLAGAGSSAAEGAEPGLRERLNAGMVPDGRSGDDVLRLERLRREGTSGV